MVHLFLSEPDWSYDEDNDSFKQSISLLNDLDSIVRLLIASQSRSEARLWLCKDLSGINSLSRHKKRELFTTLLKTSSQKKDIASQLLQMIFDKHPKKAGSVLSKKSHMLEDFFRNNPRRILLWFSNFANTGDMDHKNGAKALSQFAFLNRDICWEELEWKGKHGQSPAMVATKPHYFLDLDVEQTVENFLENVPEFWSSREFSDTLKDGSVLLLDTKFFINMFVNLMYKQDMDEIWDIIDSFLEDESFSSLCSGLLIVLDEKELCIFLKLLQKYLKPRDYSDTYMDAIVLRYSDSESSDSISELLMLNAVINRGRELIKILQEDEHRDEKIKIKDVVQQICNMSHDGFVTLIKECSKSKSMNWIKLLGLQSWAFYCFLYDGFWDHEGWESLFTKNGISFRTSGKHGLLDNSELVDESESDLDGRSCSRSKSKKKGKSRKKRRRREYGFDDDVVDLGRMDFESKDCNWLLSIDGYSTSWNSVDLPEHLSKHCFSTWMKWVFSRSIG